MGQSTLIKIANASWESAICILLILFIIFGFATKLYLSVNLGLTSDSVGAGLESMEIWKHGNYLLTGYHVTAADTFFFTELIPFQLIPQILTNYNPLTLKLVSFVIFALAVLVLSYIVYLVSGDRTPALLFAALAANIPLEGYADFAMPTTHNATIVFGGLIIILLFYLNRRSEAQKEKAGKHKKKHAEKAIIPWLYLVGAVVLAFLAAFSDTIVLAWFLAPYILAYLLFYKEKSRASNLAIAGITIVSVLAYVIKTYFVHDWVRQLLGTRSASDILSVNVPTFFKALALFLNQGLSRAMDGLRALSFLDILYLLIFTAIVLYALRNAVSDRKKWFFYSFLLLSGIIMFASFMVSDYARDMGGARYLTFTALTVLMLIAVSYRKGDKIYGALALCLLLLSAIYACTYVSTLASTPNAQEYGLIAFLESNGLSYGYGTYWDSNVITYLSGENVSVRTAHFYTDGVVPDWWLSCDRWYEDTPNKAFIIVDNGNMDDNARGVIASLTKKLNASPALHYKQYDIYPYEKA